MPGWTVAVVQPIGQWDSHKNLYQNLASDLVAHAVERIETLVSTVPICTHDTRFKAVKAQGKLLQECSMKALMSYAKKLNIKATPEGKMRLHSETDGSRKS